MRLPRLLGGTSSTLAMPAFHAENSPDWRTLVRASA